MKKNINKTITSKFLISMFASICFVCGIPLLIFGAVNKNYIVMVAGIVMVVFGFYGTPFLWLSYADSHKIKRVVEAATDENLMTVKEIATQLSMQEKLVQNYLKTAISKHYLVGYLYDGVELKLNTKTKNTEKIKKCPNCGGNMIKTDKGYVCEYCETKAE